MFEDRRFVNMI